MKWKGTMPEQYVGAFETYHSIPHRYRLGTYSADYEGEDTWQQYVERVLYQEYDEDSLETQPGIRQGGASWLTFMEGRNRHHALARPTDVDAWCQQLTNQNRTRRTNYEQYYNRIYQFYDYLKTSCRHPHVYNPLLIAAVEYETTRDLWRYRVDRRPEVNHRAKS